LIRCGPTAWGCCAYRYHLRCKKRASYEMVKLHKGRCCRLCLLIYIYIYIMCYVTLLSVVQTMLCWIVGSLGKKNMKPKRTYFLITSSLTSQYCVVTKTYFMIFSYYWVITEVFFITSLPWSLRNIFYHLFSWQPSLQRSFSYLLFLTIWSPPCFITPDSLVSSNHGFTSYSRPTARSIYGYSEPCPKALTLKMATELYAETSGYLQHFMQLKCINFTII
jgi:hypothetical protein